MCGPAVAASMLLATPLAHAGSTERGSPTATGGGACETTRIVELGPRLEGVPDSGSSVAYANGLRQTSYDLVPELQRSQAGDQVRVCLVERPKGCPKGDKRGAKYAATNLRTGERWSLFDSQHRCGGA